MSLARTQPANRGSGNLARDRKRCRDTKATRGRDTRLQGRQRGTSQSHGKPRDSPTASPETRQRGCGPRDLRRERGSHPTQSGLGQPSLHGSPLCNYAESCWLLHCLVVSIVTLSLARCPNIITTIQRREQSKWLSLCACVISIMCTCHLGLQRKVLPVPACQSCVCPDASMCVCRATNKHAGAEL